MAGTAPVIARRPVAVPWQRRHILVALTLLACVIAYTDRVNISVAAVAMKEHFGWSQTQKGTVLAAFYLGYLLWMFVAGLMADRFGGRRLLGYSVLAWSILTLLTPAAAALSIPVLIAARIGLGVGEAGTYPAIYELFGRWVPAAERSRAVARMTSGFALGTLIGLMASGWLVQRYGWAVPFYVFGIIGIVWMVVWFQQVENDPATDRRLSPEERLLLQSARPTSERLDPGALRKLLLSPRMLGIVAGHVAFTWNLYVLMSWLPSYFRDEHGLSIANSGFLSAAPWLTMFVMSILAGTAADWLIRRGVSVTATRKTMQCGALIGSASLLLALHDVHSATTALTLLCAAAGALACVAAGHMAVYLDVAPGRGAVLFAFGNTFATLPGIVGVAVTGWLVDVTGTYFAAFALTAIVSALGALAFGFLVDARPILE